MKALVVGLILLALAAPGARADSDGYYCVGKDYLAVEFRSFNTRGLAGPHVLKIARWDGALGPRWVGEVVVEEFQTHTLTCRPDGIAFEGAGERGRGWVSYVVGLDSAGVPRIVSHNNEAVYSFPSKAKSVPLPNLGNWARPGVTALPASTPTARFQLRTTLNSQREATGFRHERRTVLEQVDAAGTVRRSLLMSEGVSHESNGDDAGKE